MHLYIWPLDIVIFPVWQHLEIPKQEIWLGNKEGHLWPCQHLR